MALGRGWVVLGREGGGDAKQFRHIKTVIVKSYYITLSCICYKYHIRGQNYFNISLALQDQ